MPRCRLPRCILPRSLMGISGAHRNLERQNSVSVPEIPRLQQANRAPTVKSAVEQVLGRSIAPDEEVSIAAVPPQRVPTSEGRAAVARNLEAFLDRRAEKLNGVPEGQIDAAI